MGRLGPAATAARNRRRQGPVVCFVWRRAALRFRGCSCPWASFASRVRQLAGEVGMRVRARRKDSQEICFVAAGKQLNLSVRGARSLATRSSRRARSSSPSRGNSSARTLASRLHDRPAQGTGRRVWRPRYVVRIVGDTRRVVLGQRSDLERTTLRAAGAKLARRCSERGVSRRRADSLQQPRVSRDCHAVEPDGFLRRVR